MLPAPSPAVQALQQQVAALSQQLRQLAQACASGSSGGPASVQQYPTSQIIPFSYKVQVTMAAGAQAQVNLQMASDSTFELKTILALSTADVPTNYWNNNFTCQLTDQSTGRQLSSDYIPQALYVTNAYQYGNDEKYPILWPAQGIVVCAFQNLTVGNLTATLVLKGYKIFQTSPS